MPSFTSGLGGQYFDSSTYYSSLQVRESLKQGQERSQRRRSSLRIDGVMNTEPGTRLLTQGGASIPRRAERAIHAIHQMPTVFLPSRTSTPQGRRSDEGELKMTRVRGQRAAERQLCDDSLEKLQMLE